jgi:hypothetical protein
MVVCFYLSGYSSFYQNYKRKKKFKLIKSNLWLTPLCFRREELLMSYYISGDFNERERAWIAEDGAGRSTRYY